MEVCVFHLLLLVMNVPVEMVSLVSIAKVSILVLKLHLDFLFEVVVKAVSVVRDAHVGFSGRSRLSFPFYPTCDPAHVTHRRRTSKSAEDEVDSKVHSAQVHANMWA